MPPPAQRLVYVLASAAVAVLVAALPASSTAALAASSGPPAAYVVAIDPGHGGSPDDNHPEQLFDPGSAANGLVEKDLTLDVARRVRALLEKDEVRVVMTRDGDRFVGIQSRMDVANRARAGLFVSIHFNFFPDPSVGGSVVLYPNDQSLDFAQKMSQALDQGLQPLGLASNGVVSRPTLWVHAQMPAVTVEGAYLSNKPDADRVARVAIRQAIAEAIVRGVRDQAPEIQQRKAQIIAYRKLHARQASSNLASQPLGLPARSWLPAAALATVALAIVFRRQMIPLLAAMIAIVAVALDRARRQQPEWRSRRGSRRRRSRAALWSQSRL